MKNFNKFIEEAAAKRCPDGKYWCYDDQKCKKIPGGYHIGRGGYLAPDNRSDSGNGNGNHARCTEIGGHSGLPWANNYTQMFLERYKYRCFGEGKEG